MDRNGHAEQQSGQDKQAKRFGFHCLEGRRRGSTLAHLVFMICTAFQSAGGGVSMNSWQLVR